MFFAYCFFYNSFCQKLNIFFKLNHFNFNELHVIGQLNCIFYKLYLYLSLFILFLNLFCGFNFQQLVGKAMVILIPVIGLTPHCKPCSYHGSRFQCVSRYDWVIENWIIKKKCIIVAKKICGFLRKIIGLLKIYLWKNYRLGKM